MDLEQKLKILRDCNFSSTNKWIRAKDIHHPPTSIHGFENSLFNIFSYSSPTMINTLKEKAVERLYRQYGTIMIDYSKVPFEDLNPKDEDFKFFFEYKKLLEQLGSKLALFIDKCHETKFDASKDWREYRDLMNLKKEFIKRDYRKEILDKYSIEY